MRDQERFRQTRRRRNPSPSRRFAPGPSLSLRERVREGCPRTNAYGIIGPWRPTGAPTKGAIMTLRYDPEADAVYIKLADGDYDESEEVSPGVILDFTQGGQVMGIEILTASKTLAPGAWSKAAPPGERQDIQAPE